MSWTTNDQNYMFSDWPTRAIRAQILYLQISGLLLHYVFQRVQEILGSLEKYR